MELTQGELWMASQPSLRTHAKVAHRSNRASLDAKIPPRNPLEVTEQLAGGGSTTCGATRSRGFQSLYHAPHVLAGRDSHRCLLLQTARLVQQLGEDGAPDRALHDGTLHDSTLDRTTLHGLLDYAALHDCTLDSAPLHSFLDDASLHGTLHGALFHGASCYRSLHCFLRQVALLEPSRLRREAGWRRRRKMLRSCSSVWELF